MKGLSSTQKGQIAATLVGLSCVQYSGGKISFAIPFVDDQGVDLIFFKRGGSGKVVLGQVKSRTTDSKQLQKGVFRTQVRRASFKVRKGYVIIFVALDTAGTGLKDTAWLVPSSEFKKRVKGQTNKKVLVFHSTFNSEDMWKPYRMSLKELAAKVGAQLRDDS